MAEAVGRLLAHSDDTGRPPTIKDQKRQPIQTNNIPAEVKLYETTVNDKEAKTLYIPVKVEQQQVLAVVETAAQVSVMSRRFFERLKPRPKLTTTIILKGAGEFSEMEARVAGKVLFRIGQIKIKWNMVVADITDDVILGIDFLEHQKAGINLTDYSIELRGEKIPSTVISTEHEKKMKIYRVKLAKRTVVPPYSDKISVAEFDETPDNDIVLQPTEFMKGLLIPNMICQGRKQVSIMLRNPNDEYKTLKCGYYIGIGIEACQIMDDNETEIKTKVFKVYTNRH